MRTLNIMRIFGCLAALSAATTAAPHISFGAAMEREMPPQATLIFDFDGVICDSLAHALAVYNVLADKYGYKKSSINEFRTFGVEATVMSSGIKQDLIPEMLADTRRELAKNIGAGLLPIFPGMKKVINTAYESSFNLIVVSSNSRENVTSFLKQHDLDDLFTEIYGDVSISKKADLFQQIKSKQNMEAILSIGDEKRDIVAAKKAEITSIAVTWGYQAGEALKKESPDYLVESCDDLEALLIMLTGQTTGDKNAPKD